MMVINLIIQAPYLERPFGDWYSNPQKITFTRSWEETMELIGPCFTIGNWTTELRLRLEKLDWGRVRVDVEPFLQRTSDIHLLTAETLQKLLL